MKIKNFLVILLAIIIAVAYAYYASEKKPDKGMTLSPKEYMQLIEKDKKDRKAAGRHD